MHWTMADWRNVMFSDESTFWLVLRGYKLVRRPPGITRYDSRYIIKIVKHPKSAMMRDVLSRDMCRGYLYFFLRMSISNHICERILLITEPELFKGS